MREERNAMQAERDAAMRQVAELQRLNDQILRAAPGGGGGAAARPPESHTPPSRRHPPAPGGRLVRAPGAAAVSPVWEAKVRRLQQQPDR